MLDEIFFFLNGEVEKRDVFFDNVDLAVCFFFGVAAFTGSSTSKLWGVEVVEPDGLGGSCRAV